MKLPGSLPDELEQRRKANALRILPSAEGLIDFCSNDYLGFARSEALAEMTAEEFSRQPVSNGSSGSRLISGNSAFSEMLEQEIAGFHGEEAALIFNSGYDANLGLFSSIAKRGDTFIADKLVHASIIDGMRLGRADIVRFDHNSLSHLENCLKEAKGTVYAAIESVYSMDGDEAPLRDIAALCEKYHAHLIVDEAHATGIYGGGKGMVNAAGLEKKVFARVHTYGKAMGCHGAVVLGSVLLRQYLINFARSFIYSTALPLHSLCTIRSSYHLLKKNDTVCKRLHELMHFFNHSVQDFPGAAMIKGTTAIRSFIVPGNEKVKMLAAKIREKGYDVKPVLHPTVPKGKERLRISLHAFNSEQQISGLLKLLKPVS